MFFNIGQRVLDIAILLFITWITEKILGSTQLMKVLAIYGSLLVAVIFSLSHLYKSWRGVSVGNQIKALFLAWVCVLVVFNVIVLLLSNKDQLAVLWPLCLFRSPEFLLWSLLVFVALAAERIGLRTILMYYRTKDYNKRRAVIVGAGEAGKMVAKYLADNKWMGIRLLGFFDDKLQEGEIVKGSEIALGPVLGPIESCPGFSLSKRIDIVFIALPARAEMKIRQLVWDLGTKGVGIFLVPDLFTLGIQKAKMHQLGELHLLDLNLFSGWKRAFDIVFSLLVIIFTLPVWLMVILLIKLEDGGPIFYSHPRVMEFGRIFKCLKFRTMHVDADRRLKELLEKDPALGEEWERFYKLKNDPRVTKIGRVLRKTSLDELPQFLNVLAGQMSVVGARPVVPEELEKYYRDTALTYCATKPGITGPWQAGKRSDIQDYDQRVELDRWYVLNCSLWLDIKLIFKTVLSMAKRKGAY